MIWCDHITFDGSHWIASSLRFEADLAGQIADLWIMCPCCGMDRPGMIK